MINIVIDTIETILCNIFATARWRKRISTLLESPGRL